MSADMFSVRCSRCGEIFDGSPNVVAEYRHRNFTYEVKCPSCGRWNQLKGPRQ